MYDAQQNSKNIHKYLTSYQSLSTTNSNDSSNMKQEVKVIGQKAPHSSYLPIPLLGVTPGGRNLYHWIPGVGVPISVP